MNGPSGAHRVPIPEDVYGSWSPAASPDGSVIAFVSDRSGSGQVWLSLGGRRVGPILDRLTRVKSVSWSPDGAWLACVTAAEQGSRQQVWLSRPDGSELRLVGGGPEGTAALGGGPWGGWSADGRLLLTETVARVDQSYWTNRATVVDPSTGRCQLVAEGPLLTLMDLSGDGTVGLLRRGRRSERQLGVADLRTGSVRWLLGGGGSTEKGCLSADGLTVFACTDVDRELCALVAVDLGRVEHGSVLDTPYGLDPSAVSVLAERGQAELEDVVPDPGRSSLALLWNVRGGLSALSVLDVSTGVEKQAPRLPRDVVLDCRFSPEGSLLVTAESWSDPRGVWSVDRSLAGASPVSSKGAGLLISSRGASVPSVDPTQLMPPELVSWASFDGLELTGWLYRPPTEPPWSVLIYLHGGPESQERPVYNSLFQSLISENVAVLAPNVRGSSGFGRRFRNADNLAGRYGAIEDVASCADHVVSTGMSAHGRLACMGRSYGGYLTLATLVRHPGLFSVGVDVCGMVNFATFFARTEPWIADAAISKYGHPRRDADLLADLSPIRHLDMLGVPLLVVHGGKDTNVPVCEAEQLVESLAGRGVEHKYLYFPDEGHELERTSSRVAFVREVVSWVASHICAPQPVQP